MSKYGTMVLGPAGAGKSTFCAALIQHLQTIRRNCFYINLDPAAEDFVYEPNLDIRGLITLEDVMEEEQLGPNGGLVYCFEYLLENLDYLDSALEDVPEDSLLVIDMPGQIELYTHHPLVPRLVAHLTSAGQLDVRLCATYLLESTFVVDRAKFFAGTLSAMSAMLLLEIPHLNVLSKMDLIKGQVPRREFRRFLQPDPSLLDDEAAAEEGNEPPVSRRDRDHQPTTAVRAGELVVPAASTASAGPRADDAQSRMAGTSFHRLNRAVAGLIDEFGMVAFLQLDVQDEDSVGAILSYIDDAVQYHEAQEPREPREEGTYDTMDGMED